LSIIDTSSAGRQPIVSHDENLVMVFNGEIYNYLELKEELDYPWRTKTDSEVILAAYQAWGEQMLYRFDGMFAFVILDKKKKQLFGARDVAGIKPLYYTLDELGFAFASEPGALKKEGQKSKFNSTYLSEFFLLGVSDHDSGTMIQGVRQIKGGESFRFDLNSLTLDIQSYHSYHHATRDPGDTLFRDTLFESFRRNLRSDVPLGTSLSGGIDSSAVASVIKNMLDDKQQYYALTFVAPGFDEDESELAALVAKNAGLNWVPVEPDASVVKQDMLAMIKNMGEPFSSLSMFAQYQVMKRASELGIKVMLDGQGGDELYLGYPRMAMRVMMHYLQKGNLSRFVQEWHGLKTNLSIPYHRSLLGNIYFNSKSVALNRRFRELAIYVDEDYLKLYRSEVAEDFYAAKSVQEKQEDEFYKYCLPRLLRFADRNSMAFGVESRVPHLANPLIDMALSLPLYKKVNKGWTKYALRTGMEGLIPDEILWSRVKKGFGVPQSHWLKHIESDLFIWIDGLSASSPFKKDQLIQGIKTNPGSTYLWPVLSAVALNQVADIEI
jgi:asparagine synthase (glutamine-hydrolysing)